MGQVIDWVVSLEGENFHLYEKLPAEHIIEIENAGGVVLLEENDSEPPAHWMVLAQAELDRRVAEGGFFGAENTEMVG